MSETHHTPALLHSHLKTLRLPAMLREYDAVARQAGELDASYPLYLQQLAEAEVQQRQASAIERRLKQAAFPVVKELSGFDFAAAPKVHKKRVLDLARCGFVDRRENLVLNGAPGTGKTHLAIALGREACRRGYKVRFHTASRLANLYLEAREERQILKLEKQIGRCDLIVIDELGYLPLDRHAAEHLFGFFSQCYETTSLIVTTNLPFADWPAIFADDQRMTGALLDRLTHHVHIVTIDGESYRLRTSQHRRRAKGGDQQAKP
jgi:DNA replication protein DnaC